MKTSNYNFYVAVHWSLIYTTRTRAIVVNRCINKHKKIQQQNHIYDLKKRLSTAYES